MPVLEGLVVVAVSIGIILSNILNLAVLARMRHLPWAMRVFLLNLSASDLLVGVVACAPASYCAFTSSWPYGDVWCQISGITHGTSVTISIWSISMVGIDRYIAACQPHKYHHSIFTKHCCVIVVVMWLLAFVTFLAPIFTKRDLTYYQYEDAAKMCGLYWEYPAFCVITGAYIPVLSGSVLLFTTLRTNRALRKKAALKGARQAVNQRNVVSGRHEEQNDSITQTNRTSRSRSGMNQKAMKILLLTSTAYFTCWGPYVILAFAQAFAKSLSVPPWLMFTTLWMANTNSVINVFIYSGTNSAFRKTAVHLCRNIKSGTPCLYTHQEHQTGSRLTDCELSFTGPNSQMLTTTYVIARGKNPASRALGRDRSEDAGDNKKRCVDGEKTIAVLAGNDSA